MDLLPEEIAGQGEFDGQGLRNSNMVSINGNITFVANSQVLKNRTIYRFTNKMLSSEDLS